MKNFIVIFFNLSLSFFVFGYDLIFNESAYFSQEQSFSNKNILIDSGTYLEFENLSLINCSVVVKGFLEVNKTLLIDNSLVEVYGEVSFRPGCSVYDFGSSEIRVTGDNTFEGLINIEGSLNRRVSFYSYFKDSPTITLEPESSKHSVIRNADFIGGFCSIYVFDIKTYSPIKNCVFYDTIYGIVQEGNKMVDLRFNLFVDNYVSIYLFVAYSPVFEYLVIDNNTISSSVEGSGGVVIVSEEPFSDYSNISVQNTILAGCFFGWYFYSDYSFYQPKMTNLAYFNNYYNGNYEDLVQENPILLSESPFEENSFYIKKDSVISNVDIGYDLLLQDSEQIFTSLFKDIQYRGNRGIGYAYPIEGLLGDIDLDERVGLSDLVLFVNSWLTDSFYGDLNFDGFVDGQDFELLSLQWLKSKSLNENQVKFRRCDFNADGKIDILDFLIFSKKWLFSYEPESESCNEDLNRDGVVNDLDLIILADSWMDKYDLDVFETDTEVRVSLANIEDIGENIFSCGVFLDGDYIGSFSKFDDAFSFDKRSFANGFHRLYLSIQFRDGSNYFVSKRLQPFQNSISDIRIPKNFDPSKGLLVRGTYSGNDSLSISFKDSVTLDDFSSVQVSSGKFFHVFSVTDDTCVSYEVRLSSQGSTILTKSSQASMGKPDYRAAALGIAMFPWSMDHGTDVNNAGTIYWMLKKCKEKGIVTICLKGWEGSEKEVTTPNIKSLSDKYPNIAYMAYAGHGNSSVDGSSWFGWDINISQITTNDPGGRVVAWNSRAWKVRGLDVPSHYPRLSKKMEECFCINEWGLWNLRLVTLFSCLVLKYPATMDSSYVVTAREDIAKEEASKGYNSALALGYPYGDMNFGLNMTRTNQVIIGGSSIMLTDVTSLASFRKFFNIFWGNLGDYPSWGVNRALFETGQGAMDTLSSILRMQVRLRGLGGFDDRIKLSNVPVSIGN